MRRALVALCVVGAACVTTAPTPPRPIDAPPVKPAPPPADANAEPRQVLQGFLAAANEQRFDDLRALLSRALRERYTPSLLRRDFDAEPLAKERLRLIGQHLDSLTARGESASVQWAPGHTLTLVREPEGWRVASLD